MTMPVIELRGVCVSFGQRAVLQDIDFKVDRGEFLALIGPNGGGKTTLLRVVLGLVRPQRGSVRVLGGEPAQMHGRVAYVPQFARFDLDFPIRVEAVVGMGLLAGGTLLRRSARDTVRVRRKLEQLEIGHLAERLVGGLSGGELQRALIARAIVSDPEVLILDEPTASLDLQSADAFYELLEKLSKEMTVVLSSHDVSGVSARVGSIACLNQRLFFHPTSELTPDLLAEAYGCPVDLLAHGVPHRVLREHNGGDGES